MNPEHQRIAISEACGWKIKPDNLNDLNAMHEAEKSLTLDQRRTYWQHLQRITEKGRMAESSWLTTTASASHRAEAFLKTIGKWTE